MEFAFEVRLDLSGDAKLQWGKDVLLERGIFKDGQVWVTEQYQLDHYVDAPQRDLALGKHTLEIPLRDDVKRAQR